MYSVGSGMVLAIGDLESDVLAGGTYWLRPGSERPRQRRKASLAVIGSAVPAVAFQPPSHSSKPLSPVVP
jgi:hypothetical protein